MTSSNAFDRGASTDRITTRLFLNMLTSATKNIVCSWVCLCRQDVIVILGSSRSKNGNDNFIIHLLLTYTYHFIIAN